MLSGILAVTRNPRQPTSRHSLDAREITRRKNIVITGSLQKLPRAGRLIVSVLEEEPPARIQMRPRFCHDAPNRVQALSTAFQRRERLEPRIAVL